MDRNQILEAVCEEIARLERVRELLTGITANGNGALNGMAYSNGSRAPKKRVLSEDARNRIAQAQKRRWAKQRKEALLAKKD